MNLRRVVDPTYWRLRRGPLRLRRIFVGRWTAEEVETIRRRGRERYEEYGRYCD